MKKSKIYFAGPDVFYPNYLNHVAKLKKLCLEAGIEPLFPGETQLSQAKPIFDLNIDLIRQADGLIANLDPFRGVIEPDSGTVFECGFAYGLNKFIIGVLSDQRDMQSKLNSLLEGGAGSKFQPDSSEVENFGYPLNLMLAESVFKLAANMEEAIEAAKNYIQLKF